MSLLRALSEQIAPEVDFESFLSARAEVTQVFLPVHLQKGQEIYLWAIHAINVQRVYCDGVELKASGLYDGEVLIAPTKRPDVQEWLYPLSLPRLSAQVPAADLERPVHEPYAAGYFDVPRNWLELIVVYQVYFPGGSSAPPQTIRIWREKWWTAKNVAEQVKAEADEQRQIETFKEEVRERERRKRQNPDK